MGEMKTMIQEADSSENELQKLLLNFVKTKPAKQTPKSLFDFVV
jgi:hypothetical protein